MIALCGWSLTLIAAPVAPGSVVVESTREDYETVKLNLEAAIVERGFSISNTLHISDMLDRTGKDLGYPKPVYMKAESMAFCSALWSHRLVRDNPANIIICPFTIVLYNTIAEPDKVYVAFRKPTLAGQSPLVKDVETMLHSIVQDVIEE
jgi:uncharacterized protein (DUF302 family)